MADEELGRHRDAGGAWIDYEIDDSGDPIIMQIDPQTMSIFPVQVNPHRFDEDEQLMRGEYVVQVSITCTFRSSRQGVRYWNTVIAAPYRLQRPRASVQSVVEEVVDDWMADHFFDQSPPEIDIMDVHVDRRGAAAGLSSMPMYGTGSIERFLVRVPVPAAASKPMVYASNMDIEHHPAGTQCVADYLLWEAAKKDARKGHWTRRFLMDTLGRSPTVNRIIAFAKTEGDVSVYAVDCTMRLFASHTAARQPRVWLIFMVKEYHCLPITNERWRNYITRKGAVALEPLTFDRWAFEDAVFYDEDTHPSLEAFVNETEGVGVRVVPATHVGDLAVDVMTRTGKVVERAKWARSAMVAFEHPVTNAVIVAGSDYHERRAFCDALFKTYRLNDFVFVNQSWGAIASAYLASKFLRLPLSTYPIEYADILTRYPLGPYRACLVDERSLREGDTGIDIRRCYSAILRNSQDAWAVYGPLDHVVASPLGLVSLKELTPGEYYIDEPLRMGGGTICLSRGWYPHNLLRYAVQREYLSLSAIKFSLRASCQLEADVFTAFCDDVEAAFPEASKLMLNQFIGCLGQRTSSVTRTGCTVDLETAVSTLAEIQLRGNDGSLFVHNGTAILQEVERTPRTLGHLPIYRAVLAGAWAMLDELYRSVVIPGVTRVLAYNTDSLKLRGAFVRESVRPKEECQWGQWHEEAPLALTGRPLTELPVREAYSSIQHPVQELWEEKGEDCFEALRTGSGLILGPPGCGKTYLLAKLWGTVEDPENAIVTAYTHAACQNLRDKGLPAVVFSSLVFNPQTQRMDASRLQTVTRLLLDEYTMLPPDEMRVLLSAAQQYGFPVWAAGDYRQCTAPVNNPVEYHTNPLVLNMCGNRVAVLQYKVGTGRYDDSLYQAIQTFQRTGKLTAWKDAPPAPSLCDTNICLTNAKRKQLNAACLAQWLMSHSHGALVNVGTEKAPFMVCTGLEVMAYHGHIHEHGILKTQVWTVTAIDGDASTVTLAMREKPMVVLPWQQFVNVFDYRFAMTVQKCQGLTVQEFIVHELDHPRMTFNVVYTAISRGVTKGRVHLRDVRNWERVYTPQAMNQSVVLRGAAIAPVVCQLVIYRARQSDWPAAYIGCLTDADAENWTPKRAIAALRKQGIPDGMPWPGPATVIEEVATLFVRPGVDTEDIWQEYVNREHREAGAVYNVPSSVVVPVPAEDPVAPAPAPRASRKRKFQPVHYEKEAAYVVRCRADCIPSEHQTRWFRYTAGDEASREAACATAEGWSAYMLHTYY
jgi:hypothetical protein